MKKILWSFVIMLFLIPTFAFAAEFKVNEKSGDIDLKKGENYKNLYTAGSIVDTEANINGDLVVAGGTLNIDSEVEDNLLAAGSTITVNGSVGGNARMAGGNIYVNGEIGDDFLAAGGIIKIEKDAAIGGDLIAGASTLQIDGQVSGDVKAAGKDVIINGDISGNIVLRNVENLKIGDNATISGTLKYYSPNKGEISDKAEIAGGVEYEQTKTAESYWNIKGWSSFYSFISSVIVLLVIVYLFPKFSKEVVSGVFEKPLSNLGWGILALIVVPIIILFLFLLMFTIKLGFLLGLIYGLFLFLATIFSSLLVGYWIVKMIQRNREDTLVDWKAVILGVAAMTLIVFIPVLGPLFIFVIFIFALGQLSMMFWNYLKAQNA